MSKFNSLQYYNSYQFLRKGKGMQEGGFILFQILMSSSCYLVPGGIFSPLINITDIRLILQQKLLNEEISVSIIAKDYISQ